MLRLLLSASGNGRGAGGGCPWRGLGLGEEALGEAWVWFRVQLSEGLLCPSPLYRFSISRTSLLVWESQSKHVTSEHAPLYTLLPGGLGRGKGVETLRLLQFHPGRVLTISATVCFCYKA